MRMPYSNQLVRLSSVRPSFRFWFCMISNEGMVRFSPNLLTMLIRQITRISSIFGKFRAYLAELCPFYCQIWTLCIKSKNFFIFYSIIFKFGMVSQGVIMFNIYNRFCWSVLTFCGIWQIYAPVIAKYRNCVKRLLSARYLLREWFDFHRSCSLYLLSKYLG